MKAMVTGITMTFLSVLLCSVNLYAEATLSFTAIPDEHASRLQERFGGVAVYLSNRLGVDVQYVPVKSYAASVTAFKNNTVQLAWFGGLSGVQARQAVPDSQAIAQGLEDPNFKSYFIAHVSTGLEKSDSFPKGIAGKTFTFGSQGSTSGRLMPEYFIRQELKKSPEDLFKRVGFSGDHSKTIALVESGSYEVGAVNYSVWDKGVKNGTIDTSKVKVIWTTPGYPDYNWSIRGDADKQFGEGFTKKVQEALTALDDQKLLASFPRKKFIVASNELYTPIVETGQQLGILRK